MAAVEVCTREPLRLPHLCFEVSPLEDVFKDEKNIVPVETMAVVAPTYATRSSLSSSSSGGSTVDSRARLSRFGRSSQLSPAAKRRAAAGSGRQRPTQKRAIDDNTLVPPDLYDRLDALAREAQNKSALHRVAFREDTGKPYLRHIESEALVATRALQAGHVLEFAEAQVMASALSRPMHSCAREMGASTTSPSWGVLECAM